MLTLNSKQAAALKNLVVDRPFHPSRNLEFIAKIEIIIVVYSSKKLRTKNLGCSIVFRTILDSTQSAADEMAG